MGLPTLIKTTDRKHAGFFGVVSIDTSIHIKQLLPETFSAQQAEILALLRSPGFCVVLGLVCVYFSGNGLPGF